MDRKILVFDEDAFRLKDLRYKFQPLAEEFRFEYIEDRSKLITVLEDEFDVFLCKTAFYDHETINILNTIGESFPEVIRIVITDSEQQLHRLQSSTSAHRYFGHDHEIDDLRHAINHFFHLNEIVQNPKMRQIVNNMHSLPTLPYIYTEIMRKLKDPDSSPRDIGILIEKDLSLTAEVLRIVNSSYYAIRNKISNPTQAVVMLGMGTVRDIVLSLFLYNHFKVRSFKGISFKSIWNHSLSTAGFARQIALTDRKLLVNSGEAFISGLLNCIGTLFMAQEFPEDYFQVVMKAEKDKIHLQEAEESIFEFNHNEIGAYLMGFWGLSDSIVEAIAYSDNIEIVCQPDITNALVIYLAKRVDFARHPNWCLGKLPEIDIGRMKELPFWGDVEPCLETLLKTGFEEDVE